MAFDTIAPTELPKFHTALNHCDAVHHLDEFSENERSEEKIYFGFCVFALFRAYF